MRCVFAGDNTIELSSLLVNKNDIAEGSTVYFTISSFTNPTSVQDLGTFTISSYIEDDDVFYLVD